MPTEKEKKARVIKRYQNRKLYDTENSCYVTLEDIADYIRGGEDVTVLDNKTHEDLTTVTLSQIIFEQEKKRKNLLPLGTLKKIIQSGGEQIVDFFQKSIQSVPSISSVRGEAEKMIDKIRDEIEDSGDFVRHFLSRTHQGLDELSKKLEEKFKSLGRIAHLPYLRNEIQSLQRKVAGLEKQLKKFDR